MGPGTARLPEGSVMLAVRVRWGRSAVAVAAVVAGLVGSGLMVWQGSRAAFTATVDNPGNNWKTGTVNLTRNPAAAMFNTSAQNIVPDEPHSRCIEVTYGGSLAADVSLYGTGLGGDSDLAGALSLTVEEGTGGGAFGEGVECAAITSPTQIFTGTVAGFAGTHADFVTGRKTWSPTAAAQKRVYRFTYELRTGAQDQATMNALQGKTCRINFVWEAQNT
jgi:hypothetical protein